MIPSDSATGIAWAVYGAQVTSQGSVLLQVRRVCSLSLYSDSVILETKACVREKGGT